MDAAEVLVVDVGVNLCGGDGGVPQQGLDGAEIGAFFEQGRGETVTEGVGRDFFFEAGGECGLADHRFDRVAREISAEGVGGEGDEKPGEIVVTSVEEILEGGAGGVGEEHCAAFAAFPGHGKLFPVAGDLVAAEGAEFADAESRAEEAV